MIYKAFYCDIFVLQSDSYFKFPCLWKFFRLARSWDWAIFHFLSVNIKVVTLCADFFLLNKILVFCCGCLRLGYA